MGNYTEDINKKTARKLTNEKSRFDLILKINPKIIFWMREGSKTLHWGEKHLQGELKLNKFGLKYYNNSFNY